MIIEQKTHLQVVFAFATKALLKNKGGTVKDILSQLFEIAKIDAEIDLLASQQEEFPVVIRELEKDLETLTKDIQHKKTDLENIEKTKREKELELAEKREQIQKSEAKLGSSKTNKEFHASGKELRDSKKMVKDLEDAIADFQKILDEEKPELAKMEEDAKTEVVNIEKEIAEKKEMLSKIADEVAKFAESRLAKENGVNPSFLKKYKTIKAKVQPAMSLAQNSMCFECNTKIPPQLFIEIQKQKEIFTCPRCHRILHVES